MLLKCCIHYANKFGKLRGSHRTGKGQFSFQIQKRQCQRRFRILKIFTDFICQQDYAPNASSFVSVVCELRAFRWASWIYKRQRNQKSNFQYMLDHRKNQREFQKNNYFCFTDYAKDFDTVYHNKLWKILKEMGKLDHIACVLINLYAGQEATVRSGHGTTD